MNAGTHHDQGSNLHWNTPSDILDAVRETFGGSIVLDPCSNDTSIVGARVEYRLPDNDGLKDRWNVDGPGTTAFFNPPFGRCFLRDDRLEVLSAKEWTAGRKLWKEEGYQAVYGAESAAGMFDGELVICPEYAARFSSTSIADWISKAHAEHRDNQVETVALIPVASDTKVWQQLIFPKATAVCYVAGRISFLGNVKGPAPMPCALVAWLKDMSAFREAFTSIGTVQFLNKSPHA